MRLTKSSCGGDILALNKPCNYHNRRLKSNLYSMIEKSGNVLFNSTEESQPLIETIAADLVDRPFTLSKFNFDI